MTLIDVIGDLAMVRSSLGARASDMPVVLLLPNGDRYEVQASGYTLGGNSVFLNDKGKHDTREHAVLTVRQMASEPKQCLADIQIQE